MIIASSNSPRISVMSESTQKSVLKALSSKFTDVEVFHVDSVSDLKQLVLKKPDLVVLRLAPIPVNASLDYEKSPKIWASDYLLRHGINFTGSNTSALKLQLNKQEAKQAMLSAGVSTPNFYVSSYKKPIYEHKLEYPLFVKPTNRGAGTGIDEKSFVKNQSELTKKIKQIHDDFNSDALVEEYLPGREFSVAIARKPNSDELYAMPVEIFTPSDSSGNKFLSKLVKKQDVELVKKVANLDDSRLVSSFALEVFDALSARDYGRIDVRFDSDGQPSFIEANLMPGLSDHGYMSRCFNQIKSMCYEEMILSIIDLALERGASSSNSIQSKVKSKVVV